MRIALLSNINLDPVNRLLSGIKDIEVYQSQGYGNELGMLLNNDSPLYAFCPQKIFLVIDIMEVIGHELDVKKAEEKISEWFSLFESSLKNQITYYLSDAYLYGEELDVAVDRTLRWEIENIWEVRLKQISSKGSLVRRLQYRQIVDELGERHAFSRKMWYMGNIPHTTDFHRELASRIVRCIELDTRTAKKVLILDLDNTLWGGLAGEHKNSPVILSDEKSGLAYKNFQRVIKQMQIEGVVICIVSKNNLEDAMYIIRNHPHMVLREEDFAVLKINWENKRDNIVQTAAELNLGMDSFVFIDDNPVERKLISDTLPDVAVPDFPEHPEELPRFMADVYHNYFEKPYVTDEDLGKTQAYKANQMRNNLQMKSADFDTYLESLDMKLVRVDPQKHVERFVQLMNKTNQFNLTTKRFSKQEAMTIIERDDADVFLYQVIDKFGDNGIVAAAVVEYADNAVISEFTMSCRVMGRHIENAIIEDMENAARNRGFATLNGIYIPTSKNKPVEGMYSSVGYKAKETRENGTMEFEIDLGQSLVRDYRLSRLSEED